MRELRRRLDRPAAQRAGGGGKGEVQKVEEEEEAVPEFSGEYAEARRLQWEMNKLAEGFNGIRSESEGREKKSVI